MNQQTNNETSIEEHIYLPTSVEALDTFVFELIKDFDLPNSDDTYESIATLIMHMNQSVCKAPRSYFADSVKKSMANAAAYTKLQEFAKKRADHREKLKQDETSRNEAAIQNGQSVQ